jgi:hypothetical protein
MEQAVNAAEQQARGGAGSTAPRAWELPGGVTVRPGDVVLLLEPDYRYGRGDLRVTVAHIGDSQGRVDATWVRLIGHQVDEYGQVVQGVNVAARVSAIRPQPATGRARIAPAGTDDAADR